jgi:prepilin-type N-terminal cleavage/methylation domain-containing protein
MRILNKKEAFSLLELLVVLIVISVVVAIGIPGINQARTNAEIETMRSRAIALQNAKISYISAVGTQVASGAWNHSYNSTGDQANYALLLPYLPNTAPQQLTGTVSAYVPSPYSVGLTTLGSCVCFTAPAGNATGYTQYGTAAKPLQKY